MAIEKLDWALRVGSIEPRLGYPPRSEWGDGPWQHEPDLVEWRDEAGMPCLIVRGPMGALCGYVGLGPEHPYSGKNYNDVADDLHVHGGLTFSDGCHEGGNICHVAQPGEPEQVWWLGFDCNHHGDFDPAGNALLRSFGRSFNGSSGTYRDIHYVRAEVESLARQLRAVAHSGRRSSES